MQNLLSASGIEDREHTLLPALIGAEVVILLGIEQLATQGRHLHSEAKFTRNI